MKMKSFFMSCLAFATTSLALAQEEARLLRFPAIHGDQVVFTYAGDLYLTTTSGGVARRITSHPGYEMFARFSHDGKKIAFTGQYDGNTEVFVIPSTGGEPKRITYTPTLGRDDLADRMGPNNIVMGWTPDDQHVIYRGRGTTFNDFKGKVYLAPLNGDLSKELPFSVASWTSYNADGSKIALNRVFREFRTWKYYTGGMADDIWVFDPTSGQTENITNNKAQDVFPMYYKDKVYYVSDRGRTANLFEYNTTTRLTRQVTSFKDYDVKFPSLGGDALIFENGGFLYIHHLPSDKTQKLSIQLAEDFASGRTRVVDASKNLAGVGISPDGNRLVVSARGEIFTVPAKSGVTRNLTQSSGAHDRDPAWSPNGKWISFISDRSGEDEVYIQEQDGLTAAKALTKGGGSYKFTPIWSPDSRYLLYGSRDQTLTLLDVVSGKSTQVATSDFGTLGNYSFSPDSRWIAYTAPGRARSFPTIQLYEIATNKSHTVTDQWYRSSQPAFSSDGKYLYFVSSRDFNPTYGSTEWNHVYNNMDRIYFVRLAKDTPSPFALTNDEVRIVDTPMTPKTTDKKPEEMHIDLDGLADRVESLPVGPGNFGMLIPVEGGIYYRGMGGIKFYDLAAKSETDLGIFGGLIVSPDRKKVAFSQGSDLYIENLGKGRIAPTNKVNLAGVSVRIDLREEWKQIYNESWRQMRDYFYDPGMHGVNWKAMQQKYEPLLKHVNHRNDLTYLIGELIGELNVGHAYVNGGDRPQPDRIPMGLLGGEFSRDKSGFYKIEKILSGESWDKNLYSPLQQAGVEVNVGQFIISIDGKSMKDVDNLFQTLIGKANQMVEIEINDKPTSQGAKKVLVRPIASESSLYYHEWVQNNIKKVSELSNGRIGYVHIPDMGVDGLNQFVRYFYPQLDKDALIIDDRGNGGGNVSPMIIERLLRSPGLATMNRNHKVASIKPDAHNGPKVCLIDQYSASDGDLFPWQFRHYGLGPLIGQRTWGGVVGISGSLPFIDGGDMRKPEFAHFAVDGSSFIIEGEGVSPDIEVINDPHREYKGHDDQLAKGIEVLLGELKKGVKTGVPPIPAFPNKAN
jgi:tricorn protease